MPPKEMHELKCETGNRPAHTGRRRPNTHHAAAHLS